jgi:hypothetical protein
MNLTNTSKIIFNLLASSRTISNITDLESWKDYLLKRGFNIVEEEFYKTFDDLEAAGLGTFQQTNPNIFHWSTSPQEVSEKQLKENTVTAITKNGKRKGRPPGAKNKPKAQQMTVAPTPVTRPPATKPPLQAPKETFEPPKGEVIFCFTTKRGKIISISLDEADALIKQVELVKQNLAS